LRGKTESQIGGVTRSKKKKVPSDPSLSLAPRRHARHEAAQSRAPDVSPVRSPTGAFFAGWINASRHAAAFLFSLSWDRLLETAFPSPATKPAFANSIPGSTFPACFFASYTSVPEPVRLLAPPPVTVRPVPAASLLKPVARSLRRSIRLPPASAPRQDFYFPSVQSVQPAYRRSVRLPNPPDCLSLPVSVSIASFGSGSSFQARSVSEACCSSNLLEPFSLCARMANRSTNFVSFRSVFINSLLLPYLWVAAGKACISCGKNAAGLGCLGY
jgi:hypothetical protein